MTGTVLHPDHLADLRRSGLNDSTIAVCHFSAVPPMELTALAGVTTGYSIPYFTVAGEVNGFHRIRLFPPHRTKDGHTQKYSQPADTDPHAYFPPLHDWQKIAADSTTPLLIVEGEKKAAAGCQAGLHAIGVGGTWSWRVRVENGDRIALPELDRFVWIARPVTLIPDSDAWLEDKAFAILAGFFALGQELQDRGARVTIARLPEAGGVKVGLDDFLIQSAPWLQDAVARLDTFALDDPRLKRLQAWHQKWRRKQAAQAPPPAAPEITVIGNFYSVTWPDLGVAMGFDRVREDRAGIKCELKITRGSTTLINAGFSMMALRTRKEFARQLAEGHPDLPWLQLFEQAIRAVLDRLREEEEVLPLYANQIIEPPRAIVAPFLYEKMPVIIFSPGGAGKGYLATGLALVAQSGVSVSALQVSHPHRVLYLDYESEHDDLVVRAQRWRRGHPELGAIEPLYRRCSIPLPENLPALARIIAEHRIEVLIVDSIAPACGTELFASEAATRLFAAIRKLKISSIMIGHIAKNDDNDQKSVYGSVFFGNLARSVWELKRVPDQDPQILRMGLFNRKNNFSAYQRPLGLELRFTDTAVTLHRFDLESEPTMAARLPLRNRIRAALAGGPKTTKEIAEELGISAVRLQPRLSEGKGKLWAEIGVSGKEITWGLIDRHHHHDAEEAGK